MKFLDLDAEANRDVTVVTRYRGVPVPLSSARIQELLQREEAFLAMTLGGAVAPPLRATVPTPAGDSPLDERGLAEKSTSASGRNDLEKGVTHGSLSGRIKKIHSYSAASKRLRPMHAGFLADLLRYFDWQIPDHPRTTLVGHLAAIVSWEGVNGELRAQIDEFLRRYEAALGKAAAERSGRR